MNKLALLLTLVYSIGTASAYTYCGGNFCYGYTCCGVYNTMCCSSSDDYDVAWMVSAIVIIVIGICAGVLSCIAAKKRRQRLLEFQSRVYVQPPSSSVTSTQTSQYQQYSMPQGYQLHQAPPSYEEVAGKKF